MKRNWIKILIAIFFSFFFSNQAIAELKCTFDCPTCEHNSENKMIIFGKQGFEVTVSGDAGDNPDTGEKTIILKMGEYEKQVIIADGMTKGYLSDFDTLEASKKQDGAYSITCEVYKVKLTSIDSYYDIALEDGYGNDVPDTIWKSDGSVNEPIADVKSDRTRIWATLETSPADFRPAVKYHWYILDSGTVVKEDSGETIAETDSNVKIWVDSYEKMGKYQLKLKFSFYKDDTYNNLLEEVETTHVYYLTYAIPQAPMAKPWKEVIDKATEWAHGDETELEIATDMRNHIYYMPNRYYTPLDTHTSVDPITFTSIFRLRQFLSDDWIDCKDGANYYTVLNKSIGLDAEGMIIMGPFHTNPIIALGQSQGQIWWNHHMVGWYNNVFDPVLKFPNLHPINMTKDEYKDNLLDSTVSHNNFDYKTPHSCSISP
ncbi:MAG TPA: hypothetical protein PKH33_17235 [bacterium]|nr:hypothetical protein [bacterium]